VSHLDEFLAGWVPETADLSGDWAVHGLMPAVPPFRLLGHTKQFRMAEDTARDDDGVYRGNNRFLGKLRAGFFRAERGRSALDPDLDVIRIDYDVPKNPKLMRGLTDEVRFVSEDKLLGRGVYQLPGLGLPPRNVFWFTVTRA
jgi:hypothetical protein